MVGIVGELPAAADCTQEAFLRAFKSWKAFKGDAPVEAWLHRIAINTAISYRRRERLREVGEVIRRLGHPDAPDAGAAGTGLDLKWELRKLPPKQAAALVLRHLHG